MEIRGDLSKEKGPRRRASPLGGSRGSNVKRMEAHLKRRMHSGLQEESTKGIGLRGMRQSEKRTGKKIPPKENRNGIKEFQKASMGDGKGQHTTTITNWIVLNYQTIHMLM